MSNIAPSTPKTIPVPLPPVAHDDAKQFARQQTTNERAKQVYFRTLGVYAVNTYLRCLNIETDLEGSDLWNGLYGNLTDGANLVLPGIGQIECCPVHPGADHFVPPQMPGRDRIAYIAVQFKDVLNEVELIGYRPILDVSQPPEKIYIDEFQEDGKRDDGYSLFPIENLLDYLFNIQDIREGLDNADDPLIVGIRNQLEAQFQSSSEFAVQALTQAKSCDPDLAERFGADLLASLAGEQRELVLDAGHLNANAMEQMESDRPINEDLRQQGARLIQWVQRILGIEQQPPEQPPKPELLRGNTAPVASALSTFQLPIKDSSHRFSSAQYIDSSQSLTQSSHFKWIQEIKSTPIPKVNVKLLRRVGISKTTSQFKC